MRVLTIVLADRPGALAELGEALVNAGVSIEVQYSDHHNQLILVVGDMEKGRRISERWMAERDERAIS